MFSQKIVQTFDQINVIPCSKRFTFKCKMEGKIISAFPFLFFCNFTDREKILIRSSKTLMWSKQWGMWSLPALKNKKNYPKVVFYFTILYSIYHRQFNLPEKPESFSELQLEPLLFESSASLPSCISVRNMLPLLSLAFLLDGALGLCSLKQGCSFGMMDPKKIRLPKNKTENANLY